MSPTSMVAVTSVMATTIRNHMFVVDESGMNIRVKCRYCGHGTINNEFFEQEIHVDDINHKPDCVAVMAREVLEGV